VATAPSSTGELLALPRGSRKQEITFLGRPMISLPAWLDPGGGPSAAGDTEDSAAAAAPAPDEPDPHLQRYRDSIGLFDKWRVKILVVGSGAGGKTSLAKALSERPFNQDEPLTRGLERFGAAHQHPDRPDVRLGFVLWDLGGQDIYDSTHQLFMTADSIVVLVWQGRRDANPAALRPWLDIIADRAPLAPVVVVGTRADQFRPRVVEGPLRKRYPQIVEFLSVDNKSGTGVPELAAVLAREAVKLPSLTMSWPTEWEQAAERLRAEKGDSLPADRMWQIMMDAGVADQPSRLQLARMLHARGDLVFVEDDSRIFQRVVLTPEWINTAVYRLLDHARAQERSGITNADLDEIWAGHPAEDRDLFLDLASEYDVGWTPRRSSAGSGLC
jgi:hypothetical protein